jgi:hypothetical protein
MTLSTVCLTTVLLLSALTHSANAQVDLTADVMCTLDPCFNLPAGTTLRLNGFTVNVMTDGVGVRCGDSSPCKIIGPGTIRGGNYGVFGGKYKVEDVTFTEHAFSAMVAHVVKGTRITVTNNFDGIVIGGATGPNPPSAGTRAIIRDSVISDNLGSGVFGNKRAVVHDSVISGNGTRGVSVAEGRVKLVGSQVFDNGTDGAFALGSIRAIDSSVTGNGTDPACGVDTDCADLACGVRPRLRDSSCDTSLNVDAGGTWGVCALD